ncbi:MAG: hypothetical protein ABSE84_25470 [Isosphaeraceae bacterium]
MSQFDHAGLAGADPSHAVTFVENHDPRAGLGLLCRSCRWLGLAGCRLLAGRQGPSL